MPKLVAENALFRYFYARMLKKFSSICQENVFNLYNDFGIGYLFSKSAGSSSGCVPLYKVCQILRTYLNIKKKIITNQ